MTTLIQDEQKRQKIMARMREHLVPVLEHCRGGWVGLFLQGSQNYNLDYEGSDIDTKAIMLPSFSDFVLIFGRSTGTDEHCNSIYDRRQKALYGYGACFDQPARQ